MANKDYEQLDGATHQRLNRGEVLVETAEVPGSKTPSVVVRGVVEAAPERVWAIIDDTANYSRNLTGLKRSEEVSRKGEVVRVRVTVGMPFPLKDLTSLTEGVHTEVPGERYSRVWKLLELSLKSRKPSGCAKRARDRRRKRRRRLPRPPL